MTLKNILTKLNEILNPDKIVFKENKFRMISNNSLGIYHKNVELFDR